MVQLDISKLQYVIFDWDNTLAESRSSLVAAVNQVLAEYNLPDWEISKEKRDCNLCKPVKEPESERRETKRYRKPDHTDNQGSIHTGQIQVAVEFQVRADCSNLDDIAQRRREVD